MFSKLNNKTKSFLIKHLPDNWRNRLARRWLLGMLYKEYYSTKKPLSHTQLVADFFCKKFVADRCDSHLNYLQTKGLINQFGNGFIITSEGIDYKESTDLIRKIEDTIVHVVWVAIGILVLQILFFLLQKIGLKISWDEFLKLFN